MFEVGDVVVCVDATKSPTYGSSGLRLGATYRILAVLPARWNDLVGRETVSLLVEGVRCPSDTGYSAHRFRKVKPASAKFTAQMRALKPAPQHANHPTEGAI